MSASNVAKQLLKKTGLSSRALSRAIGLSENAISYYINGKRKPNISNCYRMIKFAKTHGLIISLEELYPNE